MSGKIPALLGKAVVSVSAGGTAYSVRVKGLSASDILAVANSELGETVLSALSQIDASADYGVFIKTLIAHLAPLSGAILLLGLESGQLEDGVNPISDFPADVCAQLIAKIISLTISEGGFGALKKLAGELNPQALAK